MPDVSSTTYTLSTLHERYQIDFREAQRLITSFGNDRDELDRLLGARRPRATETIKESAAAA